MKKGIFSYNVKKRSIWKPISAGSSKVLLTPAANQNCAVFKEEEGSAVVLFTGSAEVQNQAGVRILFYRALNELWAKGGTFTGVVLNWILPCETEEPWLSEQMRFLDALCLQENGVILQADGFCSGYVGVPLLSIQAVGGSIRPNQTEPGSGMQLMMAGHTGLSGVCALAEEKKKQLLTHYMPAFVEQAEAWKEELSIRKICEALDGIPETILYPVQEGGVFSALWNFTDGGRCGMDVDLKKIPIRQEAVEICEYFRLNPYYLMGDGAVVIASHSAELVRERLIAVGQRPAEIGHLTADAAKIIRNEDEVRYLDKPQPDEFFKCIEK